MSWRGKEKSWKAGARGHTAQWRSESQILGWPKSSFEFFITEKTERTFWPTQYKGAAGEGGVWRIAPRG